MSSEKFCLRWNDFESNISTAFRELRNDKDFFDVTLACNGEQLQAHKVILSACSPLFRNILRQNPHQHPLLYLKGVKYSDLQSVLNFMYHGEVNVAQEELNSFLAVAEELSVKGLTQNQSSQSKKESSDSYVSKPQVLKPPDVKHGSQEAPFKRVHPTLPQQSTTQGRRNNNTDDDIQEVLPVKSEPRDVMPQDQLAPQTHNLFSSQSQSTHTLSQVEDEQALVYPEDGYDDYGQYGDDQDYQTGFTDSPMGSQQTSASKSGSLPEGYTFQDPSDLLQYVRKDATDSKFYCTLCVGTQYCHKNSYNTRNHVESQHFPNVFSYPCDKCDMTFSTNNAFSLHKSRKHKNSKMLDYSTTIFQ